MGWERREGREGRDVLENVPPTSPAPKSPKFMDKDSRSKWIREDSVMLGGGERGGGFEGFEEAG